GSSDVCSSDLTLAKELSASGPPPPQPNAPAPEDARAGGNRYGWDLCPPDSGRLRAGEISPLSPPRRHPAARPGTEASSSRLDRPIHPGRCVRSEERRV